MRHDEAESNLKAKMKASFVKNQVLADNIYFTENFGSGQEYQKDVDRDANLLSMLWAALHICDLNIDKLEKGRKDKHVGPSGAVNPLESIM